MKIIKGPSGFGDAIYTRVICEWLLKNRPQNYAVRTRYPDVFKDLPIQTTAFNRNGIFDIHLQYLKGKHIVDTSQFEDMLNYAKLPNIELTSSLKNPVNEDLVVVIKPYSPMNNVETSLPMKPLDVEYANLVQENIKDSSHIVIDTKYEFQELVDIFNRARLVITQVGWAVPFAEMLDVPCLAVFTERALNSSNSFIRTITPKKICHKKTTIFTTLS